LFLFSLQVKEKKGTEKREAHREIEVPPDPFLQQYT
jgi:hypothetical protein